MNRIKDASDKELKEELERRGYSVLRISDKERKVIIGLLKPEVRQI